MGGLLLVAVPWLPHPAEEAKAFEAVRHNNWLHLRLWLMAGGNPNARNQAGVTLLYDATGPKGGKQVIKLLLSYGANPDHGHRLYTPLMNASSWGFLDGVELLLEAGADPRLRNEGGQTAIETTASPGSETGEAIVDRLTRAQARRSSR